jgi:PTH1 family peptidyl-tRNA hydrolase
MKVIVGLGNPGEKYAGTRHNAGFIALDQYMEDEKWREEKRFNALICEKDGIIFAKPLTFMNESGISVRKILAYYHLLPSVIGFAKKNSDLSDILGIIHDDIDLPINTVKISINSGSAGHKGIRSIITHLKTQNFTRLRIGIRNELAKTRIPTEAFVLQPFTKEELENIKKAGTKISELAKIS